MICSIKYFKIKACLLLLLLSTSFPQLRAQVPSYIPYQAIARDGAGLAKTNTPVSVEFRIYNSIPDANPAYREVHSITTNDFGYFNLRIGAGNALNGTFAAISWKTGDVCYEVWLDMGSGSVQLGGRTGFLSVPYALFAANAAPAPTISINSPNSVSNSVSGVYSIDVPQPTLSVNNYSLSISNGNVVELPGNYSAGNGIAINGTVISNSAPDQPLSLTGAGVSGTYPSYTITQNPSTSLTAGNNMNIQGTGPAYTLSPVTPTLVTINNAFLTGAYPNQTLSVPAQSLSLSGSSISLSGGGGTVSLPQAQVTTINSGTNVTVSGSAPNFTVSAITPTLNTTGNVSVSGTYPLQTLNVAPQVLSLSGNSINLSGGGGTVTLPQTQTTTVSSGTNITVSGSTPNFTVSAITPTLNTTGNVSVSGTYPLQTLNVPAQVLSISGKTVSLSNGGGSVTVPATNVNAGNNVTISGSAPDYTVNAVTPTLTGTGNLNVSGTYPNQTLNVPAQALSISGRTVSLSNGGGSVTVPATNVNAGNNVTISGSAPDYTVNAVTPTLTGTGNLNVSGTYPNQTLNVTAQTLSISGSTVSLSSGGGSVTLPPDQIVNIIPGTNISVATASVLTAKNFTLNVPTPTLTSSGNITVSGTYPNQMLTVPVQSLSVSGNTIALSNGGGSVAIVNTYWDLNGNSIATGPVTNFIGTTNAAELVFKTNNLPRMIITSSGSVGIGVGAPQANFDVNYGTIKLGAGSDDFSYFRQGLLSTVITTPLLGGNTIGTINLPGALPGDTFIMTLNTSVNGVTPVSATLNRSYISSPNTVEFEISSGLLSTSITLVFSYILYRN